MRSQPENQALTVQFHKAVSVGREIKWYFWKCNQRLTHGVWFAKCLRFYTTASGQL